MWRYWFVDTGEKTRVSGEIMGSKLFLYVLRNSGSKVNPNYIRVTLWFILRKLV